MADESFVPTDLCDDLICCVVCYEHFSNERIPKALPCLHTFCTECLRGSIKSYQTQTFKHTKKMPPKEFPCPICKEVTKIPENGLSGFKDDFRIRRISEMFEHARKTRPAPKAEITMKKDSKKCEVCIFFSKESISEVYCLECNKLLCSSCSEKHKNTPIAKDHNIVSADEILPSENDCKEHVNEVVRFYCRDCCQNICATCTFTDVHSNHAVVELAEEKEKVCKELQDLLENCKQTQPSLSGHITEFERLEQELADKEKSAHKAILLRTVEEISKIRREQYKLEQDLESVCRKKYTELRQDRRKLQIHVDELDETCKFAQTLLERGQDFQIVSSFPDIRSRLQCMSSFKPHGPPETGGFTDLGKYDLLVDQFEADMAKTEGSSRDAIIAEMKRVASQMKLISIGRYDLKVEKVKVIGKKGDGSGEFNFPSGVAVFESGDIAVADLHNERVQIFNRDGVFKSKFGHDGFKPCGVAITKEGTIAVTDTNSDINCVKVYTVDGVRKSVFGRGEFDYPFSLAVDSNNRFVVSDPARNEIVVLLSNGDVDFRFHTRTKFAFYLTVDCKDHIILSDWYCHCIRIFDSTGVLVRRVGSRGHGDGQLMIPLGLTSDSRGTLLVLDCKCQRISMFGADGKFIKHILEDKEENIVYSRAIALSRDGRLVITHGDNKRNIPNEIRLYQI